MTQRADVEIHASLFHIVLAKQLLLIVEDNNLTEHVIQVTVSDCSSLTL